MEQQELKVYWQPGCSSCVKVKELLSAMDVPYTSIDVLADPAGFADLMALGVRSVPVVRRGNDFVFAQAMEDVAAFVGRPLTVDRLPAAVLVERCVYFLETTSDLIRMLPADRLTHRPFEKRPRTMRDLGAHIFQPPHAFLEAVENGLEDLRVVSSAQRDDLRDHDDLLDYAGTVTDRLKHWGKDARVGPGDRIKLYYGEQPVHQVLERSTWHSAQHVRQFGVALDSFGLAGSARIDPKAYEGLPMPNGVWE